MSRLALRSRALLRAGVASVVLAAVSLLGPTGPVWAHTTLVSTEPAAGTTHQGPPAAVTLTFSEAILPRFLTITLTIGDGAAQQLPATVDGAVVTAALPEGIGTVLPPESPWRVDYRVVATDGHPITGGVEFIVAASSAGPDPSASPDPASAASETGRDPVTSESRRDQSGASVPWLLAGSFAALVLVSVAAATARRRR